MSGQTKVNKICSDDLEATLGNLLVVYEDQVTILLKIDPLSKSIHVYLQKIFNLRLKLEEVRELKRNRYEEIKNGKFEIFEACVNEFFKQVPEDLMEKVKEPLISRIDKLLRDDENEPSFSFENLENVFSKKPKVTTDL